MAIDKETEKAVLVLLAVAVFSKLGEALSAAANVMREGVTEIEKGGASLYELVHPDENDHANDLPPNPKPGKGVRLPPSEILAIAQLVGFPDPKLAAAIAMAESSGWTGNTNITPREYSVGLWQINTKAHPYTPDQMREPMQNAQAALAIYKRDGWKPWGAYTSGRYKQFQQGILA
jgi:hypothetical protein